MSSDGSPRPACESDPMPVLGPGASWLMMKLTLPTTADGTLDFTPGAAWMPDTADPDCPRTNMGVVELGRPMPLRADGPNPLPENEIEMLREWIRMGAPGPG